MRTRFCTKLKAVCEYSYMHTGFFKHVQDQKLADEAKKSHALFKGKIAPEDVKCAAPGCHNRGKKKCGRCKSVAYCSKKVRGNGITLIINFRVPFTTPNKYINPTLTLPRTVE